MYKSSKKICLICLLPSNKKMPVKHMKECTFFITGCSCNALFHKNCLYTWFTKSMSCPICLKPIIIKNKYTFINNILNFVSYNIHYLRHFCNIIHFSLFCFIILMFGYVVTIFDN